MIKATDISVFIIILTALIVLLLEAIGNKPARIRSLEKPHIYLLSIGVLTASLLLICLDLMQNNLLNQQPFLFINNIASLFLIINTTIFLFMIRNDSIKKSNSEFYFFVLASLALSISNISMSSLMLKIVTSIAWLVVMTALSVLSISGGKKAEVGVKMSFSIIIVALLFIFSLFILYSSNHSLDLDLITLNDQNLKTYTFIGLILIALIGLSFTGTPPFHFGYIDCISGGNVSVAFLFLSNSIVLGSSILFQVKIIFTRLGFDRDYGSNFLGFMLVFGFILLCFRSLDQSTIRRTIAYIALSIGPLFSMSILFGGSILLPKLIFLLSMYSFSTLALFILFGSLVHLDAINLPWQTWEDIAGFGKVKPLPTLTLLIALSTIAGLPGTLGYFVKLSLIAPFKESLLFSGAIILSIALEAVCVMRIFVFMFSKSSAKTYTSIIDTRPPLGLFIASAIMIVLGFFPFVR